MYSSFHPVQHDAWIRHADGTLERTWKYDRAPSSAARVVRSHLTFPRETRLEQDLKRLRDEQQTAYSVVITSLDFDLDSLRLSRRDVLSTSSQISE